MLDSPIFGGFGNWNPIGPSNFGDASQLIEAYWNSHTIGVCVLDTQLKYVCINETLAAINGIPVSAHEGKSLREVVGDIADQIEPPIREVFSHEAPVFDVEVSGRRPNAANSGKWVDHFYPIRDDAGRVIKVCVFVFEIREDKQLREAFQELQLKLSEESERLRLLLDVNALLSSNFELSQVFLNISGRIRRVLHHEYAALALHDPATGLLIRQAVDFPLSKGLTSSVRITSDGSPSGRALQERASKIYSKEELNEFTDETSERFLAEGIQSMCCVPLLRPKGALGVLSLGSTRESTFAEKDLALLEQVAAQIAIAIENRQVVLEVESLKERLGHERKYLEGNFDRRSSFSEIIGESLALKRVLEQVATVASSEATVLILGETGTGKELIAHSIHRLSRLKGGPFIRLNCAAIPTGLLESELFGHEKGAFTGAISQKIGRMELADGGTLFLDEVGEIPLELQPKLLRVLQDQEFERLGSNRTIRVKVRLVAATNCDLADAVANHEFRSDLYYRLNVFPVHVPPLRDRRDDIPMLVRYFVHKFSTRMGKHIESVATETMDALSNWHWPGNVRELENLIERSVILSEGRALRVPLSELRTAARTAAPEGRSTLDAAEREHIIRVLRETRGVLSGPNGAAKRLGLKRTTLQSKMQRLHIARTDYMDMET